MSGLVLKQFWFRLLMRRGGFFAPAPRLGLVTLTGTLVFSLVLMPVLDLNVAGAASLTSGVNSPESAENPAVLSGEEADARLAAEAGVAGEEKNRVLGDSEPGSGESPARTTEIEYMIEPGDTLYGIAQLFQVNLEALAYMNDLVDEDLLTVGQKLMIPPRDGLVHTVKTGENVSLIAQMYGVSPQAIVDYNLLASPYLLYAGDRLTVPDVQKIPQRVAETPRRGVSTGGGLALQPIPGAGGGRLQHPVPGATVSQYFSSYHPAADFSGQGCGAAVMAAESGQLYFAAWWPGGGGNTVMIDHGGGLVTKYAHLGGFARESGPVSRGEVIGYVGATGRAYGCHLHFIVQRDGRFVDPLGEL